MYDHTNPQARRCDGRALFVDPSGTARFEALAESLTCGALCALREGYPVNEKLTAAVNAIHDALRACRREHDITDGAAGLALLYCLGELDEVHALDSIEQALHRSSGGA